LVFLSVGFRHHDEPEAADVTCEVEKFRGPSPLSLGRQRPLDGRRTKRHPGRMDELLRFTGAVRRDPRIEAWFALTDPLRLLARPWFERMRGCGPDVRELLHDGCPVACVGDAPFGYVNAFKAHASVGFFHGAMLADPAGLLEGTGKRMRHVKLRRGKVVDEGALGDLIAAAYEDMRRRLGL
jgi:hypothetical protein